MIPAIAQAVSTDTARLDFPEPLTFEHQLLIQLLTDRYVGKETPFMTFSRNGVTTLIVPKTITRVFPARNES